MVYNPLIPTDDKGSIEGNHLGYLYYTIVQHVANSYLEPPDLKKYIKSMMVGRRSTLESVDEDN